MEFASFMEVAREHRLGLLFEFMARTGLRRGEALGLCREDVDSAAGYLVVRTALVQVGSGVVEGGTKTEAGASRRVALASDTIELLKTQRLRQVADQVRWGSAYQSCGHGERVFAREDGSDLTPEQVTKTFAWLVKVAGVRRQRLHDLRHLSASFDALAGVPINVTSKRLGHSNPAFTMRVYQHLYAETATQAAEAAAAFFPARPTVSGGGDAPTLRPQDLESQSETPTGIIEQGADLRKHQSRRGDSNPQPPVYKTGALPIAPRRRTAAAESAQRQAGLQIVPAARQAESDDPQPGPANPSAATPPAATRPGHRAAGG